MEEWFTYFHSNSITIWQVFSLFILQWPDKKFIYTCLNVCIFPRNCCQTGDRERERENDSTGQIKANLVVAVEELGIFPTSTWSGTFCMQNISCITKFLQYWSRCGIKTNWVKQSREYLHSLHVFWWKEKFTLAFQNRRFLMLNFQAKDMQRAMTKLFITILISYKMLSSFPTLILNHVIDLKTLVGILTASWCCFFLICCHISVASFQHLLIFLLFFCWVTYHKWTGNGSKYKQWSYKSKKLLLKFLLNSTSKISLHTDIFLILIKISSGKLGWEASQKLLSNFQLLSCCVNPQ